MVTFTQNQLPEHLHVHVHVVMEDIIMHNAPCIGTYSGMHAASLKKGGVGGLGCMEYRLYGN